MKILLAVDGSTFSQVAAESVARRLLPANSEIRILTVIEPFQPYMTEFWTLPANYWDEMEKASRAQAEDNLQKAMAAFRTAERIDVRVTPEAIKGNPKQVVLDEAETWGADLIVVGSHGYSGFKRMLLGSVSQAIASHAPCSVEIVRTPALQQ